MPKARPDKVEFEKRLITIQGWMIESIPSAMIVQQILLKDWAKSERHAFILLQKARERWIKFEDDNILEKRKMRVQELRGMIRAMKQEYKVTPMGIRTILSIQKEISKLEGVYFDPDKVTPTIISVDLSQDEIRKYSKALEEEY